MPNCIRCNKEEHASNLIAATSCFSCHEKTLKLTRKILGFIEISASIYKFLLLIAGVLGLLYLIITPIPYIALILLVVITGAFMVISLFGMLPNIFPAFSNITLQEMELKFKDQYSKYTPGTIHRCIYHPEREAVARCSNCFQSFCAEDMIFIFERPNHFIIEIYQ